VLDPSTGDLRYCNAGHIPPLWLSAEGGEALGRTGLPLGILEDAAWEGGSAHLAEGDSLLLYTDGVTDAQARDGVQLGQERLQAAMEGCRGCGARELRDAVLGAVHQFTGDAPRFDDVTLVAVCRR